MNRRWETSAHICTHIYGKKDFTYLDTLLLQPPRCWVTSAVVYGECLLHTCTCATANHQCEITSAHQTNDATIVLISLRQVFRASSLDTLPLLRAKLLSRDSDRYFAIIFRFILRLTARLTHVHAISFTTGSLNVRTWNDEAPCEYRRSALGVH